MQTGQHSHLDQLGVVDQRPIHFFSYVQGLAVDEAIGFLTVEYTIQHVLLLEERLQVVVQLTDKVFRSRQEVLVRRSHFRGELAFSRGTKESR
ncbi:hypothetical protein D3C80_2036190 [compost metagenome]